MKKSINLFILLPLIVLLLTTLVNNGFMASDEYWTGITRYIPAQKASLNSLIREDDVKSHLQLMPFYYTSQLALKMGIEHPYKQYQFARISLAIINSLLTLLAFYLFSQTLSLGIGSNFHFVLLAFFYPAAFVLTRPMFESMAAPWLTLATVLAYRYDFFAKSKDLLWAVVTLSIAFCLRPQVGFAGLVLVLLPLLKGKWKDLSQVVGLGAVFFILSGLPDLFLRGHFHHSLLSVTVYNFKEGHNYGEDPWFYYLVMIPLLCLLPFWAWFVAKKTWVESFKKQRAIWFCLILFVFLHSLFSQKFERFIIPIIPTLILLMSGFFIDIWSKQSLKPTLAFKIVFVIVLLFNFLLFVPASFWPAQQNIINLALYLDENPQYTEVNNINESFTWIPELFIDTQTHPAGINKIPRNDLSEVSVGNCQSLIVVNEANKVKFLSLLEQFQLIKTLDVNPIEKLAFKLNPDHNIRRSPLYLYTCKAN